MVEFALISVLLFTLLFGIIEFGYQFNNAQAVRQGVREGARQGAVAKFGSSSTCGLTGLSGSPSSDVQKLMCLTKSQIGLGNSTRVKVLLADADVNNATPTGFVEGNALIVCAQTPMQSLSGLFAPVVNGKVLKSKTTMRIEQTPGVSEQDGAETAPSGSDWSWCTVTGSAP